MSLEAIYKVIFYNRNEVYEIFARTIYQSEMYGFIEVEELLFGERSQVVVDPGEEKLKNEFSGVKRTFIPMQNIIRIDEVDKEGTVKVSEVGANDKIAHFPFPQNGPKPSDVWFLHWWFEITPMPLHSKKQGQGPALVLLHGLFGSLENLAALARQLQNHFTVYSIDLPNHGRSSHYSSTDLDLMSNTVMEWMREHKIERAHLLGHSLGGKIAMQIALTKPELVEKLVVMDIAPSKYDPHHHSVFDGLHAVDINNLSSRSEADEAMKPHVPEMAVRSFLLKNITKATTGNFIWRMNLPVIHKYYAELIRENANAVFDGATFFVKGGASDYITEKSRADIEKRFPNASYKIVSNVGHWLHAEKPALVASLIEKFLIK